MKIRNLFWNIYVKNILIALVILVVLIFVVMQWLNVYTLHGKQVIIPDVKGMPVEEATLVLTQKSLHYAIVDSMYVRNKPARSVLEITPPVGTNVKEGRTVYLTVNSAAAQLVTVPQVADMSRQQAETLLRSLGFESFRIQWEPGIYKDLVIGLENTGGAPITAGSRISASTPLVLLVYSGEEAVSPIPEWDETLLEELNEYEY